MLLLHLLDLIADDFTLWPTDVLFDIFVEPSTIQAVERVASFAYGNGIPLQILTRFLRLSNPEWDDDSFSHLYALYHMWKVESNAAHRSTYYNVKFMRLCWINGDDHAQDEFVLNGEGAVASEGVPIGFELTTHESAIVRKLNSMRDEEYVLDILS